MNRSKVCCKAGSVDFYKRSIEKVTKVWALTGDYCICKNTRLAAFYRQTKNGFSIHGLLKRSSVQLGKLKSSAF